MGASLTRPAYRRLDHASPTVRFEVISDRMWSPITSTRCPHPGAQRRALAHTVSVTDEGLASRDALQSVGLTHVDVRTEVAAGRWRCHGKQTVALHCGPISVDVMRWRALWETGVAVTALDGVTALQAAGLRGFDDDRIHVSVAHTARVKRVPGVVLHKVIRRPPTELAGAGIPRTTPAVAAVRAAGWSVSDRQAALVPLMTTQQRLATPDQMLEVTATMPGRSRRVFIKTILLDAADGVQSLGELDFARLCRRRGLPEPSRQAVRRGPRGRIYLDVRWDNGLVVEIDGAQHREGLNVTADNLSRNAVTLANDRVLRIDLVGLRLYENEFLHQVALGLGAGQWR